MLVDTLGYQHRTYPAHHTCVWVCMCVSKPQTVGDRKQVVSRQEDNITEI